MAHWNKRKSQCCVFLLARLAGRVCLYFIIHLHPTIGLHIQAAHCPKWYHGERLRSGTSKSDDRPRCTLFCWYMGISGIAEDGASRSTSQARSGCGFQRYVSIDPIYRLLYLDEFMEGVKIMQRLPRPITCWLSYNL